MSELGRSRLDAIRSLLVGGDSATTVDPVKLIAYRNAFDRLRPDEQDACLARLTRGLSYEQIALDLGEPSAAVARETVTRAMDRLLGDVFGHASPQSERLADLLGQDAPLPGDRPAAGAPADMSPEEEAVLRELLILAKTAPPRERWGKFTDLKEIGSGGFGTVYSAFDSGLQTRVALKLYHRPRSQRPKEDLLGEARKLARVRHPNVVVVHGAEEIDGQVGVWMELVEGKTLDDEVRNGPNFDEHAAAEVGIALCEALEAVHAAGIVHGDIKAQNVVRGTDGRIVLMDFGAARLRDPAARESTDTRAGTPQYMARELFDGSEPTVQSDIYALGVLLFYLVTGKYPVQGNSAAKVKNALDEGPMLPLQQLNSGLRYQFVEVVERALSRTPGRRQQTAALLKDELERTKGWNWAEVTRKVVLGAAAFVVIGLLSATAIGFLASRAFEVLLGIDPEFSRGAGDYLAIGGKALLPLAVHWAGAAVGLGVGAALLQSIRSMLGSRLEGVRETVVKRLRSADAKGLASAMFLLGMVCWGWITWTFSPETYQALDALWSASSDTTVDFSILGPSGTAHQRAHGEYSAYLSFLLGLSVLFWFPWLERKVRAADFQVVRVMRWATVGVIVLAIGTVTLPRQVIWESYTVVDIDDRPAFVVGENDEQLLLLFAPVSELRYQRARKSEPPPEHPGGSRRLFDETVGQETRSE